MDPAVRIRVEGVAAELVRDQGAGALSVRSLARRSGLTRSQVHTAIGNMPTLHRTLRATAADEILGLCLGLSAPDLSDPVVRRCVARCLVKVMASDPLWADMAFDVETRESPPTRTLELVGRREGAEPPMVEALGRLASSILLGVAELVAATGDEKLGEEVADVLLASLDPIGALVPYRPEPQSARAIRPPPQDLPADAGVDERILASARQLVRAGGVDAVSMRSLAQHTHYGKSTVHAHVVSRSQLIETLRTRARAELSAVVDRVCASAPESEDRRALLGRAWAEGALADPVWWLFALDLGSARNGDRAVLRADLPLLAGWELVGRSSVGADLAARYLRGVTRLVVEAGDPAVGARVMVEGFGTLERALAIVGDR